MSGRTAGRYGGSSDDLNTTAGAGAGGVSDDAAERRLTGRYDRHRSRSGSAERQRRRGERYARLEPTTATAGREYAPWGSGDVGGMNPNQLLPFLQGGGPYAPTPVGVHNGGFYAPPQVLQQQPQPSNEGVRSSQSVQDFIPTVPKSLLGLLRGPDTDNPANRYDGTGESFAAGPNGESVGGAGAAGQSQQPMNALVMLEAPKIAPEVMRRARECRRAHVSGFPSNTTEEELMDFFRLIMPDIRRVKTQREVRELGLAAGDAEDELRQIPANAQVEVDQLRNVQLRQAKSKAFAFIEVTMADLVTEMVEESAKDPERFIFHASSPAYDNNGRGYAIMIRRPKDFEPLDGYDEGKVVMTGFHPSLPEDKLRAAMEQFGQLDKFEVKNGLALAEFANANDAVDCRTDLHGEVLGQKMVVVLPLYYWLKCVCFAEGIDVTVEEDDPISGKFALTHDLFGPGGVLSRASAAAAASGNAEGEARQWAEGAGGSMNRAVGVGLLAGQGGNATGSNGALVVAPNSTADAADPMKDLLSMAFSLPEVTNRFGQLYPHLRPLYGNTQVPIYATRVLALFNLFDEEELVLDTTYSQLLADIEEEVEKYGRVEELIVPRREGRPKAPNAPKEEDFAESENPEEEFAAAQANYQLEKKEFSIALDKFFDRQIHPIYGGFGRVFVVYETVDEAAEAQQQIAGKLFGNRTVVTSFVFEDLLKDDLDDSGDESNGSNQNNEEDEAKQPASGEISESEKNGEEQADDRQGEETREADDNGGMVEDLD